MDRREFLVGGSTISLVGTAGCTDSIGFDFGSQESLEVTGAWPRPEFDSGSTGHNLDVSGPTDEPEIRWEAKTPVDSMHVPAVVVSDGVAFFAGGSIVTAIDVTDGSQVWQTQIADEHVPGGGRGRHCSMTVDNEFVYVGTHEGLAVLTKEGEEVWSYEVEVALGASGVFRSPAVSDGTVYFGTAEEQAVSAYTTDGDKQWQYECDNLIIGSPSVTDDGVFVATSDGDLHAFSTDGEHRWTKEIGTTSSKAAVTPTVFDGTVYATAAGSQRGNALVAFDAQTGDEVWRNNLSPSFVGSMSIFERSSLRELVCPTWHGTVFTYNVHDGSVTWGVPLGDRLSGSCPIPATDKQSVYIAAVDSLTRIAPRRERAWQVSLEDVGGSVAVLDDALLVGSIDGRCYALA